MYSPSPIFDDFALFVDIILSLYRSQNSDPKKTDGYSLDGINPSPEKTFRVVFHVLIPKDVWGWNNKTKVHLQFGHFKLGKWEAPIGEFECIR